MGHVHNIAHSNYFSVKNLYDFQSGLEGFKGESGAFQFKYLEYKKHGKNAEINVSSESFEFLLENDKNEELNIFKYIQKHINDGEICVIHFISYEHAADMSIEKYIITSNDVKHIVIVD